jgi:hypothetical protein
LGWSEITDAPNKPKTHIEVKSWVAKSPAITAARHLTRKSQIR